MTTFTGFPDDALTFYDGLEADNSKTYWTGHLDVFERAVRGPMLALLAGLEPEFGPAKLFRPYRDVRFSSDKSPYKTQLGAVVHTGAGEPDGGGLYVALGSGGLFAGGGYYQLAKDQLDRYRQAVVDDTSGPKLDRVTDKLAAAGLGLSGDTLQRAPRGVDPTHPRIGLLRRKGLAAGIDLGAPDWLSTPRCADEVAAVWRRLRPMMSWLHAHVGPSQEPPGRAARLTR
jgi:uncharacterized protein (TIGR02453 family)